MLVAVETLFFRRRDHFAIHHQRRRRIVSDRAAQTENDHCRPVPSASRKLGFALSNTATWSV